MATIRPDTSQRQQRRLHPCPCMVLPWCPWNAPVELFNFNLWCPLPRRKCLVPLPFQKRSIQACTINTYFLYSTIHWRRWAWYASGQMMCNRINLSKPGRLHCVVDWKSRQAEKYFYAYTLKETIPTMWRKWMVKKRVGDMSRLTSKVLSKVKMGNFLSGNFQKKVAHALYI